METYGIKEEATDHIMTFSDPGTGSAWFSPEELGELVKTADSCGYSGANCSIDYMVERLLESHQWNDKSGYDTEVLQWADKLEQAAKILRASTDG